MANVTQVKVYSNVPWDDTYTDVRYFEGGSPVIPGTTLYTGTQFSYQRVTNQISPPRISYSLRVPVNANNLYSANYIAFNNGTKWFYGFVKEVNYINANVTEIIYVIDSFTTWFYDCTLHPSYVVREHSSTDEIGDSLTYEDVGKLSYIDIPSKVFESTNAPARYTIFVTSKPDGTYLGGQIVNGLYTGSSRETYNSLEDVNSRIQEYVDGGHLDSIVGVFNTKNISGTVGGSAPTEIDGYTPKNKKLLTNQFNRLVCCSYDGAQQEFSFELFSGSPLFSISSDSNYGGNAICVPQNYKGVNYNYAVTCENQLACAWSGDLASQFLNYTGEKTAFKMLIGTGVNAVLGGLLGGKTDASDLISANAGSLGSIITYGATAPITAQQISPSFQSGSGGSALWALNKVGFHGDQRCITAQIAEVLDSYFSEYGYNVSTVKQPNLTGRAYFNYVKLRNPCVTGSIPVYAMNEIKRALCNGVKFWHTNNVGVWNPKGGNPIG